MTGISFEGIPTRTPVRLYANIAAAAVLTAGMALCYDTANATEANRYKYLAKPSLSNIDDFAGYVAPGTRQVGPGWVDIIPFDGTIDRLATLATDESITSGDLLGPIPETFYFGKCVVGRPVAKATQTADRSATAGTVTAHAGQLWDFFQEAGKIVRYHDEFMGTTTRSATADAATFVLTGTGATATFEDALTASDNATANQRGYGVLKASGATTGWKACMTMNGEPFTMATGKSIFLRARFAVAAIAADSRAWLGLALGTATDVGDATTTDHILFRVIADALSLIYGKDATSSALGTATGSTAIASLATMVAAEFVDVAFMVRNKISGTGTGAKELTVWVNGTAVTHTLVPADIVDNESLTLVFGADDSDDNSAQSILVDRITVQNYVG